MDIKPALEAVEAIRGTVPVREQANFDAELATRLGFVSEAAGPVAVEGAQAEVTTPVEAPADVLSLLSPEQQTRAESVIAIMAETFGIDAKNVRLVLEDTPETGKRAVAIDASPNGQYGGSWNKVTKERQKESGEFTLDVDGTQVDALAGTTDTAYRAMITDAKARGVDPLPDSYQLSEQNDQPWTYTMLTGELLTADGGVRIRRVRDGGVDGCVFLPDRGRRTRRVRPAVVVAQLES